MFRPEMLEPMGFPPDVRVHGWGLSLERPTMIRCVTPQLNVMEGSSLRVRSYGISNIRDLLGHKVRAS